MTQKAPEGAFCYHGAMNDGCPFCDTGHIAYRYLFEETPEFYIASDYNPLVEGHLLIIPKEHAACTGAFSDELFAAFQPVYEKARRFVRETYGSEASFEHGVIGQSVSHAHMHVLPFAGSPDAIVPEGGSRREAVAGIEALRGRRDYLYFSIGERSWTADPALAEPRFFRKRFGSALGSLERADWKKIQDDPAMRAIIDPECARAKERWEAFER